MVGKANDSSQAFEAAAARSGEAPYVLRLYVAGMSPRSTQAVANIKSICEQHLRGRYELEIIDVYQHSEALADEQIVAVPTLVKQLPLPLRKLIGDMSNTDRVLLGLDLRPKAPPASPDEPGADRTKGETH